MAEFYRPGKEYKSDLVNYGRGTIKTADGNVYLNLSREEQCVNEIVGYNIPEDTTIT
jgi:hypothetical protein